ncbi:MAG: hypothetical protein ABJH04_07925 [Cyclobacteriaceae bacterium]
MNALNFLFQLEPMEIILIGLFLTAFISATFFTVKYMKAKAVQQEHINALRRQIQISNEIQRKLMISKRI